MRLEKRLKEWETLGLIDHETSSRLRAHEESKSRPLMLYAISGLGALSLCLGLISLIAANWYHISDGLKLSVNLFIGLGLCGSLAFKRDQWPKWGVELIIAVICGWTLASIALIGQIYQLGGDGRSAITLWALLVVPLLMQGRSTLSGVILLGALLIPSGLWLIEFKSPHIVTIIPAINLGVLALSFYRPLTDRRPEIMKVFGFVATLNIIGAATVAPVSFYTRGASEEALMYLLQALLFSLPALVWLWRIFSDRPMSLKVALIASVLFSFGPLLPHTGGLKVLAILSFIIYWVIIAKTALDLEYITLFRFATFAVAARLVIMYFELVGSLLDTGLLFITGGALILFVTRFWYQKQHQLLDQHRSDRVSEAL